MSNLYIGIMSGTSLDGIDIALCEIDAKSCKLVNYKEYPFPSFLKKEILFTITENIRLRDIGILNAKLGLLYAKSVLEFLQTYNLNASQIKAIGLHGQTLWHEPNGEYPFSMQQGDPNIVVAKTGIKTVSDFRSMDIANGGEGAPFAPAFHQFLFSGKENRALVNIGGMANITLLGDNLQGWDTGCGNVLLDLWMHQTQNKPYDKNGAFSKSGNINTKLLHNMLNDAYFQKSPPKSTGREYFNQEWLHHHLQEFLHYSNRDIARTLLELTALTITNDLKNKNIEELIVCGGGSKNAFLMQRLEELSSCKVLSSNKIGFSADALEAMAFAWFAYKRVHLEPIALSSVTHAKKESLLGGIYE